MTSKRDARAAVPARSGVPRWVPFVLVLALTAHLAFELTRFPAERASEISRWERELSALADDRRRSLTELLKSDSLDVRAIAGARRVELFVRDGADAGGEATPALVQDVLDRFTALRHDTLHGTWIVSGHGTVLASAAGIAPPDPACLEALANLGVGQPGPIHRHGATTIVPIAAAIDPGPGPRGGETAAVLFAFDAGPLFSRLARRPSQPRTVESYLVRSHEGRLEFLSPLLFGEPVAGALDDPLLGARAAAEGRDSFSEGLDYRSSTAHPVLTVTRALPGTGWGLVVEVDVSEALASLEEQVRSRRLLWAVIWFGSFALVYAASRSQRAAVALESGRVAARYAARLDQANDAILIMDEAGRILEVNRRAMEFYERTEDELLTMPGRDLRPPELRSGADQNIQAAFATGAGLFEAVHVRASGSRFPVEISARVVTDEPGERRIVVVVRDITARRADAERIERLNRLLRTRSTVSEVLVRSPDERQLLEEVCRISVEQAGFLVAWVGLANRATGKVEVAARAGTAQDYLDEIEVRFDEGPTANGPTGTAIREERTVKISSFAHDERTRTWSEQGNPRGFGASAATPIRRSGQVIGALSLYSAEHSAFDPEVCGLVEEMAADIGFALTAIDTRRRQAEADRQVHETERRFRTVLENLPLLVLALDDQGRVLFWNRGAEEVTGLGPEVIGKPLPIDQLYADPAVRDRVRQAWRRQERDPTEREATIRTRDGAERTIVWRTLAPLVSVPGWASWGIGIDVTKIRRAEEQARRVLLAIEQVSDSVIITDQAGAIVYANPAACRIAGYELSEMIGQHPRTWSDRPGVLANDLEMSQAIRVNGVWQGALVNRTKSGAFVHLSTSVGPIRGASGEIDGYVAVGRDLTHERALLVAKEAAEQTSRAKSSFLAHISHEIRTPMNAILGYAQLLLRDQALPAGPRAKLDVIRSSGLHLLQILNDVLEMSRIEAGRVSLTTSAFDLPGALREVERMFTVLAAAKHLGLTFELAPDLPRAVQGDRGKVKQVVINLLSNAVKFTDRGAITVRVSATRLADEQHQLTLEVEDTGVGMDRDGLSRLFGTFEQLEAGARMGGTGLGLAISRNFAQLMGGDLTVRSTPGRGSVFTFTFVTTATTAPLPEDVSRASPVAFSLGERRPRALIVDDVELNRVLLDELLSGVGFETRTAASGEEALVVHQAWRPDVVLLDVRMPGMGGLEASRRLRAARTTARIVALSASGIEEDEPEARTAGADVFIRKPYDEAVLLQQIVELVGLSFVTPVPVAVAPVVTERPPLAQLLSGVPLELLRELRQAASEARAARVQELSVRVGVHSEPAAVAIRGALADFRYELIVGALEAVIDAAGVGA